MSFSRELKDFAEGYRSGWQLANQSASVASQRAKTERYDEPKHGGDNPFEGTPTPQIETSKPGTDPTETSSTTTMPNAGGKSIVQQAYGYYRQKGLSHNAAAGIAANIGQETGNDPRVVSGARTGDAGASYFAAQWNGSRLTNLKKFAGTERPTLQQQFDFILEEMNPNSPYVDAQAAKMFPALQAAKTADEAVSLFRSEFERPSADDLNHRLKYLGEIGADTSGGAPGKFEFTTAPAVDIGGEDESDESGSGGGSEGGGGGGEEETSYVQPPEAIPYPEWVDQPAIQLATVDFPEDDFANMAQSARKGGLIRGYAEGGAIDPWNPNRGYTQALPNQTGYKPYDPGKSTVQPRAVGTTAATTTTAGQPTASQTAFRNIPKAAAPVATAAQPAATNTNSAALQDLYKQLGAAQAGKQSTSGSRNVGVQNSVARGWDQKINAINQQIAALRGYRQGGAVPEFADGGRVTRQLYQQKIKPGPGSQFRSSHQDSAGYVEAYQGDEELFTKPKQKAKQAKPEKQGKPKKPAEEPPKPKTETGTPTPPQPKPGRLSDEYTPNPPPPYPGAIPSTGNVVPSPPLPESTSTAPRVPSTVVPRVPPSVVYRVPPVGAVTGSSVPPSGQTATPAPQQWETPQSSPARPTEQQTGKPAEPRYGGGGEGDPTSIFDTIIDGLLGDSGAPSYGPTPAQPRPGRMGEENTPLPKDFNQWPRDLQDAFMRRLRERMGEAPAQTPNLGYAQGGAIPDDPLVSQRAESANYQTAPARPELQPAAAPAATQGEPEEEQTEDVQPTPTLMGMVKQAVSGGLNFLKEHFSAGSGGAMPTQGRQGANKDAARRMAGGEGAATGEEIEAIDNAVDPQRRYNEGDRQLVRLAKATNWYLDQGRPKDAAASAASLLQAGSLKFSRLGTYAQAAYENYVRTGDKKELQNTIKILQTAYGLIPDGAKVNVTQDPETGNLQVVRTDENGNDEYMDVSPDQLPGLIQKTMDSSLYWQRIFALADPAGSRQKAGWAHTDEVNARKREENMQDWATKEEYKGVVEGEKNTRENIEEQGRHERGVKEEAAKNEREKAEAAKVEADKKAGKVTEWKKLNPLVKALGAAKKARDAIDAEEDPDAYQLAQDELDKAASAVFDALPPEVDRWTRMKDMGFYPEDFTYVGGGDAAPAEGGETMYKGKTAPPNAPNARRRKDGTWWIDNGDGTYSPVLAE